jgi:hypothetical protein
MQDSFTKLTAIRVHNDGSTTNFIAPTALIALRSDFFKTAIKHCWQQDDTEPINLYNQDPEVFSLYLHILFGEPLHMEPADTDSAENSSTDTNYITLCQVYVLAEFLQDARAKESMMKYLWDALIKSDGVRRLPNTVPGAEALHILYYGTKKDSLA